MNEIKVKVSIRIELEEDIAEDFDDIKEHLGLKHNSEVIRHLIKFKKKHIELERERENHFMRDMVDKALKDRITKEERQKPK